MADVILYWDINYGGGQFPINSGAPELGGWDGQTSSIVVNVDRWVLFYRFSDYGGNTLAFHGYAAISDLTKYPSGPFGGNWNDEIASVQVMPEDWHPRTALQETTAKGIPDKIGSQYVNAMTLVEGDEITYFAAGRITAPRIGYSKTPIDTEALPRQQKAK